MSEPCLGVVFTTDEVLTGTRRRYRDLGDRVLVLYRVDERGRGSSMPVMRQSR